MGDVTAELLKSIGMNVDFVATDWGTVGSAPRPEDASRRRAAGACSTPWHAGADCVNPASYTAIRANGDKAWFGWPGRAGGRDRGHRPGSTPRTLRPRRRARWAR